MAEILEKTVTSQIPYRPTLTAYYIGIFIWVELAFVVMALKEYDMKKKPTVRTGTR
jgi:hypothetical protein